VARCGVAGTIEGETLKSKLLQAHKGERTYALIFEKGDDFMATMTAFAQEQALGGSYFTAIGAFSDVLLGFFDRRAMAYQEIPVDEQVELLSLVGNIADNQGEPKIHVHVVVGRQDGTTRGGHLLQAHIWPTLEVILTESPGHLQRQMDQETGLPLLVNR
jgi:predicted DNA-binding protein with PD1-like motif